ncbi:hypothetical protein L6452_20598 [Arctium lappa]|uniref:Uncharacterized protein n=1 Tax=Arctium lappa TaxID=4217 RepID=A0ACB9BD57_ARCLA|nr:hypothetical protein L6452_20598 [Arctium lappa]
MSWYLFVQWRFPVFPLLDSVIPPFFDGDISLPLATVGWFFEFIFGYLVWLSVSSATSKNVESGGFPCQQATTPEAVFHKHKLSSGASSYYIQF